MRLSFQKYVLASLIVTTSHIRSAYEDQIYNDPKMKPYNELTLLISEGNVERIETFLNDYNGPHKQFLKDHSLSMISSSQRPVETLKLLLDQKATIDQSKSGDLLTMACHPMHKSKGVEPTVISLLLNARADINSKTRKGYSVIKNVTSACFFGPIPVPCFLRLLDEPTLELNQDNDEPAFNILATARALKAMHLPVLEKMLECGANPNIKDDKETPHVYETIVQRYCKWHKGIFYRTDLAKPDRSVTKSVLLILKKHLVHIQQEQESIKSIYPKGVDAIITQYSSRRIAPDAQELENALALYKDVEPVPLETADRKEN